MLQVADSVCLSLFMNADTGYTIYWEVKITVMFWHLAEINI
jgi:hypothetical protein